MSAVGSGVGAGAAVKLGLVLDDQVVRDFEFCPGFSINGDLGFRPGVPVGDEFLICNITDIGSTIRRVNIFLV